jgi:hypothetical protein
MAGRDELLNAIKFDKLNEESLEELKKNEQVPKDLILDAALKLCAKLRKQLEDHGIKTKPIPIPLPTPSYYGNNINNTSNDRTSYSSSSSSPYRSSSRLLTSCKQFLNKEINF